MNPSELTLLVLRLAFLLVLWLFIFGIVYALRSDLFGHRVRKLATDAPAPAPAAAGAPFATPPPAPPAATSRSSGTAPAHRFVTSAPPTAPSSTVPR